MTGRHHLPWGELDKTNACAIVLSLICRTRTVEMTGVRERTVKDHLPIVVALKKRDPAAAWRAMLQHLNSMEQELLDAQPVAAHEKASPLPLKPNRESGGS